MIAQCRTTGTSRLTQSTTSGELTTCRTGTRQRGCSSQTFRRCCRDGVLDLGCGDGRLTELILRSYPGSTVVCVDLSKTMLAGAARRLPHNGTVDLVQLDFDRPLPEDPPFDRPFDAAVSSFAYHYVDDGRKRTLYAELARALAPGGILTNLEIVASPTPALHQQWRKEMGAEDDPADHLSPMATQLRWLSEAGLVDVDCIWKWRSLSLLRGRRP